MVSKDFIILPHGCCHRRIAERPGRGVGREHAAEPIENVKIKEATAYTLLKEPTPASQMPRARSTTLDELT